MEITSTKLTPVETLNALAGVRNKIKDIMASGDILLETEERLSEINFELGKIIDNQCNWFSMMNCNEI